MADADRVAVLIDCDNISWQLGGAVLAEAAKTGTLGVKRGYGDWSSSYLSGWKSQLSLHAIQPMQQSAYIAGKNATDSALIIDAMDLLYSATSTSSISCRATATSRAWPCGCESQDDACTASELRRRTSPSRTPATGSPSPRS